MPRSSSNKTQKQLEELTYEEALAELESIVAALEGDASRNRLDESIKLFERGQALAERCSALLEAAELKVKKVVGDALLPFEEESE
jgi:exodeoxyribonuclease VII small subunit